MKYLCLIYSNENDPAANPPLDSDANQPIIDGYVQFGMEAGGAGVLPGGDALMPTSTARTVRVTGGATVATDGPFAETKEQLGGYYLIDCETFDEAVEWAAKIPHAAMGSIEVRPVQEFDIPDLA